MKLLVLRYSALGDVVLATSVLDPLLEKFPGAHIEWVTDALYAPLLQGLSGLAAVHVLDRSTPGASAAMRERLRGQFDVALDLQHKVRSAFIAWGAAPRRLTFHRRNLRGALLALVGADRPLVRAHATQLYAEALAPLGVTAPGRPRIHLSPGARALAADALDRARGPIVAIAPGARWATKRWPAERFAEVGDALAREGASLVLAGGPGDRDAFDTVRAHLRSPVAVDLSPLPVDALAAALARVQLLIACDSGPATWPPRSGPRWWRCSDRRRPSAGARPPRAARSARPGLRALLGPRRRLLPGGSPPLPGRPRLRGGAVGGARVCSAGPGCWRRGEPAGGHLVGEASGSPGALAAPLALAEGAFRAAAALRGALYAARLLPVARAGAPVVSIGNLAVGGAGKTPATLAVAEQPRRARPQGGRALARLRREPP